MRILIYGAGVIGSLYAVQFAKSGFDVSVYARGKRLADLKKAGLLYLEHGEQKKAEVKIIEKLNPYDIYDFIFLTVKEYQAKKALFELRENKSPTIVTMINNVDNYARWEEICGKGRILPAFPGAGGGINGLVLHADFTPGFIQSTGFGEINGEITCRARRLYRLFRDSGIPCQMISDMYLWQLSHLAMVVPMADAYYEANYPECAGKDLSLMFRTAKRLKRNFKLLKTMGFKITPFKLNLFQVLPSPISAMALSILYQSSFGYRFMYRHTRNAPDEMKRLHIKFYRFLYGAIQEEKETFYFNRS